MESEKGVLATADPTVPGFGYCPCALTSPYKVEEPSKQELEPIMWPNLERHFGNLQPNKGDRQVKDCTPGCALPANRKYSALGT